MRELIGIYLVSPVNMTVYVKMIASHLDPIVMTMRSTATVVTIKL